MTTQRIYQLPVEVTEWKFDGATEIAFNWEYDDGSSSLLELYEKGKQQQWNASTRLDWSLELNPDNPMELKDEAISIYGTEYWNKMTEKERAWLRLHLQSNSISQFMHGEQGALLCTAKIVETVPWIDAKYYASTQVMDEARHVEVFSRYLDEKLTGHYPINAHLQMLLDDIIADSRWDMTYLGMQIMVEGLALAAFGFITQMTTEPLLKQLLRNVMADEARHVAFGVLSLQEFYRQLSAAEIRERQEFAFEAAVRMRDRFLQQEVWERMGVDVRQATQVLLAAPERQVFQAMLSRRPVFAMLHEDSTAVDMIRSKRAGSVVTLSGTALPDAHDVAGALQSFMADTAHDADAVDHSVFDAYSARGSTRALAAALDLACERAAAGRG